ncbi:hypothetical protein PC116_g29817 [Phytophthora cactorum]|nr:hypothetical protein PC116_g29817 [Phytophthora cactorum]
MLGKPASEHGRPNPRPRKMSPSCSHGGGRPAVFQARTDVIPCTIPSLA